MLNYFFSTASNWDSFSCRMEGQCLACSHWKCYFMMFYFKCLSPPNIVCMQWHIGYTTKQDFFKVAYFHLPALFWSIKLKSACQWSMTHSLDQYPSCLRNTYHTCAPFIPISPNVAKRMDFNSTFINKKVMWINYLTK